MERRPYVDNYPPLRDWLRDHEARCLWQLPVGRASDPDAFVECHLVGTSMVVVLVRADRQGWDLFTPCADPEITATLADAERRCSLTRRAS